jgi:hypothetical protein
VGLDRDRRGQPGLGVAVKTSVNTGVLIVPPPGTDLFVLAAAIHSARRSVA